MRKCDNKSHNEKLELGSHIKKAMIYGKNNERHEMKI